MKKIIIVCDSLRIGGIQSSLKSLLKNIENDYKIDLFLFNSNSNLDEIPSKINIYSGKRLLKIISYTRNEAKQKGLYIYLIRILLAILCKIFNSKTIYSLILKGQQKFIDYDVAISFSNNVGNHSTYFGCNQFVLSNVDAKEKITWLHVDYEAFNLNTKINNNEYKLFDKIICVSEFVKKQFLKYNKNCINKCYVIENIIDYDEIKRKSKVICNNKFNKKAFNIISVGRLDDNKNQILQLKIALKLKRENINFKWYFVGDGINYNKYKEYILTNNLTDDVFLLGNKENPYNYINNSDLLVSTSKSESYGLTIVEALVLNVPVVAMYYGAIDEINGNNNIVICHKEDELYENIQKMIINKEFYKKNKDNAIFKNKNYQILAKIKEII